MVSGTSRGSSSVAAAAAAAAGNGGWGGGGGGPSIRFEGITLELSSFSGCQFDFGKNGSLILSFDGYTGTVTLQSPSSSSALTTPKIRSDDTYALPLCSTSSEAGSLGVLDCAEDTEAVAMDQSDYDMALSQLEQGDSPQSFSAAAAAAAVGSPESTLFSSPSAMRYTCEGTQDPAPSMSDAAGGGTGSGRRQPPFAAHVSPSSSMKGDGDGSGGASLISQHRQQNSPAGAGPRNSGKKRRPSPTASAGVAARTTTAISPDAQPPSSSSSDTSTAAAASAGKPKEKRARRARVGDYNAAAPASATGASASASKNKSNARAKKAGAVAAGGGRLGLSQAAATGKTGGGGGGGGESKAMATPKQKKQCQQKRDSADKENRSAAGSGESGGGRGGGGVVIVDGGVDAMDTGEGERGAGQTHVSDDSSSSNDDDSDRASGQRVQEDVDGDGEAASPSSAAAAAWIAMASFTRPESPGPLSRSAKAQVVGGGVSVERGGSGPMGRWGHTATMITESTMMVLGGQADDEAHQATLGDLYKFDFVTESWSRPVNCDTIPRAWHTASFIEDKNLLVIFGGERTVDGCPECLDDIMVLDTDIDLLYPPAISGKSPSARSGHSAAIIGTDLIVFGGVRGRKWQNNVAVLDTERWHWRHPTIDGSTPAPRSYHTATVVGNLMVVFGGNNQKESFDKVHVLDTTASRWVWSAPEVVGVSPCPRTGHSAVLLADGHTILIHGGWDPEDEEGLKNFGDAYLLDTNLWEWSRGPESLLAAGEAGQRVGHTALLASCNGNIGGDAAAAAEGSCMLKAAYFGGQDGAGVRCSQLALLTL